MSLRVSGYANIVISTLKCTIFSEYYWVMFNLVLFHALNTSLNLSCFLPPLWQCTKTLSLGRTHKHTWHSSLNDLQEEEFTGYFTNAEYKLPTELLIDEYKMLVTPMWFFSLLLVSMNWCSCNRPGDTFLFWRQLSVDLFWYFSICKHEMIQFVTLW